MISIRARIGFAIDSQLCLVFWLEIQRTQSLHGERSTKMALGMMESMACSKSKVKSNARAHLATTGPKLSSTDCRQMSLVCIFMAEVDFCRSRIARKERYD